MNNRITVYNRQHIKQWKKKLKKIPQQLDKTQQEWHDLDAKIKETETKAQPLKSRLSSINSQISLLTTAQILDGIGHVADTISRIPDNHSNQVYSSCHPHNNYNTFAHVSYDIITSMSLNQLYAAKAGLESDYNPLKEIIDDCSKKRSIAANTLNALRIRQDLLSKQIPDAKAFLKALESKPQKLVNEKCLTLLQQFKAYDKQHHQQPYHTRYVLNLIDIKLRTLIHDAKPAQNPAVESDIQEAEINTNYSDFLDHLPQSEEAKQQAAEQLKQQQEQAKATALETARIKYALLAGFIIDQIKVSQHATKKDHAFIDFLYTLLNSLHIGLQDDLPDEFKTGQNCATRFQEFAKLNRALYLMDGREFNNQEIKYYSYQVKCLLEATKHSEHPHHQAARYLINKMNQDLEASTDKCTNPKKDSDYLIEPNYAAYSRILDNSNIIVDPNTSSEEKSAARSEMLSYVKELPGASSTSKKVLGGMIAFIGISISVASILFCPPISPFVAVFSIGLIGSCAGIGTGVALTAVGSTLFHFGRERKLAKAVTQFCNIKSNKPDVKSSKVESTLAEDFSSSNMQLSPA